SDNHPKSGQPTVIEQISAFGCTEAAPKAIIKDEPYHPFISRADFEFTELAHAAALSREQTNELLHLIYHITSGQSKLNLKSYDDVSKACSCSDTDDTCRSNCTKFEKCVITIQHKKEELEFDIYLCPLWNWATDLLQDPLLTPHFIWDAEHLYKHNGIHFEWFVHEPRTADHWWNIQSELPENGVPFTLILYANKTHLSSLGKVKVYPVIAHCGNLPVEIRNMNGIGGGCLVGLLPIVSLFDLPSSGTLLID
ncbi:hypothetical protein BDN67DRAFT_910989, partial [Paxillus ammoniavirescens]